MRFFEKFDLYSLLSLFLFVPILAMLSSYLNLKIKTGNNFAIFLSFVLSFLLNALWFIIIRHEKISLSVAAAMYDLVYSFAYFGMFILLGESVTFLQGIGLVLSLVGMFFLVA